MCPAIIFFCPKMCLFNVLNGTSVIVSNYITDDTVFFVHKAVFQQSKCKNFVNCVNEQMTKMEKNNYFM